MGLDQSSRAVELKPLKEKRKGFRHTLAIRKAGRTDSDDMRVYRWLKAYIKQADPHRTPPRWRTRRRRRPHCPASVERRDGAAPPHTPHPRRARAQPARPLSITVRAHPAVKITSYPLATLNLTAPDRGRCVARGLSPWRAPAGPSILRRLRTLYSEPLHVP
jgi:hypothetical protein